MSKIVVFDLDGVLADYRNRVPLVGQWDKYGEEMLNEPVIGHGKYLINCYGEDRDLSIYIVTGRVDERFRGITQTWLAKNGIKYDRLIMRPLVHEDWPDNKVRYEQIRSLMSQHSIVCMYDDSPNNIVAVDPLGINTCLVNFVNKAASENA